jgi:hypothetical protein
MTTEIDNRAKYPDGRLIPLLGELVYCVVPAFGGSAGYVYGKVTSGRGGALRVQITGTDSFFGREGPRGRTMAIDARWTVRGDPMIIAREEKAERDRKARAEAERAEQKAREDARTANTAKYGELVTSDLRPGDVIEHIDGARFIVTSIYDGKWPCGRFDDDAEAAAQNREYTPGRLDEFRKAS